MAIVNCINDDECDNYGVDCDFCTWNNNVFREINPEDVIKLQDCFNMKEEYGFGDYGFED